MTTQNLQALNKIENIILDMDGVLWTGKTPMPNLPQFFDTLADLGISVALATNNASKSPDMYVEKFAGMGVTVREEQIVSAASATISYLQADFPAGTAVSVLGGKGLKKMMREAGYVLLTDEEIMDEKKSAALCVVGYSDEACYRDFAVAAVAIRRGARFIGTNPDLSFPSEYGFLPGAGSIIVMLEAATDIAPYAIIGKPGPIVFEQAMSRLGGSPETTAMVGDRLNTDIAGAIGAGLTSILVLSGITQPEEIPTSTVQPDFVFSGIGELSAVLQEIKS